MLESIPSDGGSDFVVRLDRPPFPPEDVYKLLEKIAPNTAGDYPAGILADWEEPDRQTTEARDRIAQHEALPGWAEFMASRRLFMRVMEKVPEVSDGEGAVYPITNQDQLAEFAAALLVEYGDRAFVTTALENLKLSDDDRADLDEVVVHSTGPDDSLITHRAHDELAKCLAEKPDVIDVITQTLIPALEGKDSGPPSGFFTHIYAARLSQSQTGEPSVEPFTKVKKTYTGDAWRIEGEFRQQRAGRRTFSAADLLGAQNKVYAAVLDGTLKSRGRVPRIRPEIRWRTEDDGTRDFTLKDGRTSLFRNVTSSGVFGVMLAASLQPEVTSRWPGEIQEQAMGIAQVPVMALGRRGELLSLLSKAEELISRPDLLL